MKFKFREEHTFGSVFMVILVYVFLSIDVNSKCLWSSFGLGAKNNIVLYSADIEQRFLSDVNKCS